MASNLSLWSTIINRTSSSYYLHDKDSKAINITLLSQHSSAGIFWCNITTERKRKGRESLSFDYNNHTGTETSYNLVKDRKMFGLIILTQMSPSLEL